MLEINLLLLLLVANGSPVVMTIVLGKRPSWPIDAGLYLPDGKRLFGASKTLPGLALALVATALAAMLLGPGAGTGALIGAFAMLGDLLSSFIKRRFGLPSGAGAPGLDQVPEALLPLWVCKPLLDLSWLQVIVLTAAFAFTNLLASRVTGRSQRVGRSD